MENYAKNPNQVTVCTVPRDVIENADITFSCLSDPKSVKGVIICINFELLECKNDICFLIDFL